MVSWPFSGSKKQVKNLAFLSALRSSFTGRTSDYFPGTACNLQALSRYTLVLVRFRYVHISLMLECDTALLIVVDVVSQ
jgi:hypothetical protein